MTGLPFDVPYDLFPARHRFTEVDGTPVHYIDEGTGDTLLLLHGNPSWSFLYRKMIPVLSSSFRCVAVDYPGYGMSGTPDGYGFTPAEHSAFLERFVDQLGLRDLTLMVQDWGGPIGLGLAARRPDLVRALVIGNTFAWPLNGNWRIEVFSWVMGGPVGRIGTRAFNLVPRFFFSRGLAGHTAPEVTGLYLAPWRDPARRKAAVIAPRQLIKATAYLRQVESGLPALASLPALIVWGTADFAFRNRERERFERAFPAHTTILYPNASHFLQEDAGEQIAEQVTTFLRGLPAQ